MWWPDTVAFDDSTWIEKEEKAMSPYWVTAKATFTGMGPYWDDFNQEYTIYPDQSIGAPVMFYGPEFLEPRALPLYHLVWHLNDKGPLVPEMECLL